MSLAFSFPYGLGPVSRPDGADTGRHSAGVFLFVDVQNAGVDTRENSFFPGRDPRYCRSPGSRDLLRSNFVAFYPLDIPFSLLQSLVFFLKSVFLFFSLLDFSVELIVGFSSVILPNPPLASSPFQNEVLCYRVSIQRR